MPNPSGDLLAFGSYRLDRASRVLTRSGKVLTLAPKTFDLLAALAGSHGRLLTKRELIDLVWPDVAVEEANLSFQISALRKALGEEGNAWIETVPKYGYRFNAPVQPEATIDPVQASERPIGGHVLGGVFRRELPAGAVGLLVLVAAGAIVFSRTQQRQYDSGPIRFTLELPPQVAVAPASIPQISPDGRKLLYTGIPNGRDKPLLYLRPLGEPDSRPLPGTEGAVLPFWSPDSRSVGFFTSDKLLRLDLGGGPPTQLCTVGRPGGGTWGTSGTILFSDLQSLRTVPASGGECRDEHAALEYDALSLTFLPDGARYLFSAFGTTGAFAGRLGSTQVHPVVEREGWHPTYVAPGFLLWIRQGELMGQPFDAVRMRLTGQPVRLLSDVGYAIWGARSLYSVSETGVLCWRSGPPTQWQLAWYDGAGQRTEVGEPYSRARQLALSPDGKWAVIEKRDPITASWDLWLLNLNTLAQSRLTNDPADDTDPVWSPDSSAIVFSSNRNGQLDLYEKSIGGMDERLRFADSQRKVAESWIAGKVLFVSAGTGLFAVASPGNAPPQPVLKTEFLGDEYHVSPDGHWVAYNTQESGTWQVYVAAFPSFSQRRQVSTSGGGQALWHKDGTRIYYLSQQGDMMVAEIKTSPTLELGIPRRLFQTRVRRPNLQHDQYGVTPDGSRFLVMEPAHEANESINVLVNWRAALMPGGEGLRGQ